MKTCNCINEINDKLREQNLRLTGYAFMMPDFRAMVTVSTDWVDREKASNGRKKFPPAMQASHCPFCGVKYAESKKAE